MKKSNHILGIWECFQLYLHKYYLGGSGDIFDSGRYHETDSLGRAIQQET